jgi:hypothetical protein
MLGYVDEALNGKIILISDKVYSWDTWNADNYPEAFNYPEETSLVGDAIETVYPKELRTSDIAALKQNVRDNVDRLQRDINSLVQNEMKIDEGALAKTERPSAAKSSTTTATTSSVKPNTIKKLEETLDRLGDAIDDNIAQPIRDALTWLKKRHEIRKSRQ